VILTLPFSGLRRLDLRVTLSAPQRRAIAELGYSTPTKLITAYRQKVWRQQGLNGLAYTDLPMQHCWEASDSLRSANTALLVAYPGGQTGQAIAAQSSEQIAIALHRDLSQLFPAIAAHRLTPRLLRSEWLTDPWSAGAYSCYQVGQWTAFYGWEGRRVERLWLAGEHCSRRYQGYMEGACETAERVVAELLSDRRLTVAAQQQRSRLQHLHQQRTRCASVGPTTHTNE
jgi:monoamine oxidase